MDLPYHPHTGGLYSGPWAQLAVSRYISQWLPMLLGMEEPAKREILLPPVDVALVWLLHRTSDIHLYVEDCNVVACWDNPDREPELLNVGPDQALGFSDGSGSIGGVSALAWQCFNAEQDDGVLRPLTRPSDPRVASGARQQPYWPPQLQPAGGGGGGGSGFVGCGSLTCVPSYAADWEEDARGRLLGLMRQALWLLDRLLRGGFTGSREDMAQAVDRYCRFLLLAQRYQSEPLLFPPDVLLVWWAHKAHSGAYLADMDVLMGCPFDPVITSLDDPVMVRRTAQLYEEEYGLPYIMPCSVARTAATQPTSISNAPTCTKLTATTAQPDVARSGASTIALEAGAAGAATATASGDAAAAASLYELASKLAPLLRFFDNPTEEPPAMRLRTFFTSSTSVGGAPGCGDGRRSGFERRRVCGCKAVWVRRSWSRSHGGGGGSLRGSSGGLAASEAESRRCRGSNRGSLTRLLSRLASGLPGCGCAGGGAPSQLRQDDLEFDADVVLAAGVDSGSSPLPAPAAADLQLSRHFLAAGAATPHPYRQFQPPPAECGGACTRTSAPSQVERNSASSSLYGGLYCGGSGGWGAGGAAAAAAEPLVVPLCTEALELFNRTTASGLTAATAGGGRNRVSALGIVLTATCATGSVSAMGHAPSVRRAGADVLFVLWLLERELQLQTGPEAPAGTGVVFGGSFGSSSNKSWSRSRKMSGSWDTAAVVDRWLTRLRGGGSGAAAAAATAAVNAKGGVPGAGAGAGAGARHSRQPPTAAPAAADVRAVAKAVARRAARFSSFEPLPMRSDHPFWLVTCPNATIRPASSSRHMASLRQGLLPAAAGGSGSGGGGDNSGGGSGGMGLQLQPSGALAAVLYGNGWGTAVTKEASANAVAWVRASRMR